MYYLTYRPKTIHELDNSNIRDRLQNLLASKDIPHALLFIGPKGMGKTSTARIFAKAVNCERNVFAKNGDSIEPCNTCKNCMAIDTGSSPDVVEQDAASSRGIDEVRKIIKEASFAPMTGRYRVYIIDEAHMITPDAFNALLKTLEEPPKSVIFILATTNDEKVPVTIQSRCVTLSFGVAQYQDIMGMLERIATAEKLTVSKETMELIATYSENSFRDATKLLEELVIQGKLGLDQAQAYLGIRSKGSLLALMQKGTHKEAMSWVVEFVKSGGNVKRAIEDILMILRDNLVAKSVESPIPDELSFSRKEISMLIRIFHEAYVLLKSTPIPELPLELAITEFYNERKSKESKQ